MFDELWSEIAEAPGEIFDVIEYKEEWEKDDKFDVEGYIKGNTDYWCLKIDTNRARSQYTFFIENGSRGWTVGQPTHKMGTGSEIVYCRHMEKITFKDPCTMAIETDRLTELQDFMFDTMCSAEMAVDWYCDRFEVSATDEVIDFVLDAHDAFFGNW